MRPLSSTPIYGPTVTCGITLNTKAVIDGATTLYTPILKFVTHEGLRCCEPKLTLLQGGAIYADIIEIDGTVATLGDAMSMGYIVYE